MVGYTEAVQKRASRRRPPSSKPTYGAEVWIYTLHD